MQDSSAPSDRPSGRTFYGWYVVAALIAMGIVSTGATVTLPRLAFPQMTQDFHASIAAISSCIAVTIGVGGLMAPFGGALIDRFGPKRLLLAGVVILAVAVSLYPFVTAIWQLYVLHVIFGVEASACSLLVPTVLISRWFVARRGMVIGLFLAGLTATGVVLPNLIALMITSPALGWRAAFGCFAVVLWLIVIPLLYFVIRETPADVGRYPDGAASAPRSGSTATTGLTFGEALRTPVFWLLAAATAFLLTAVLSVISHLALYLTRDSGLGLGRAAYFMSLISFFDLAGKFLFGLGSDRFSKRRIAVVAAGLMAVASLMLLDYGAGGVSAGLADSTVRMTLFAAIWGLGQGGLASIYMLLMPECFGQRELGRIMGSIMLIGQLGQSLGVYLAGYLRTATGSYTATFGMVVVCTLCGALCYVAIRPVRFVAPDDAMPAEAAVVLP